MIKVLHIGEYVNGGVATYIQTLLTASKHQKIEHYLLMSDYKSQKTWNIDKNRVFYYSYKRGVCNIIFAIKIIQEYIGKLNPDIIHVHSSWAGVFARVPFLFKKKPVKIVYTPHGWSFLMGTLKWKKWLYVQIEKLLMSITDKVINISNYEQKEAIKYGLNKNKMSMIYNGVIDKKIVQENKIKLNVDKRKINLLFVGRLDEQKGLDVFLKVYYQKEYPMLHLYVIGKGILEKKDSKSDSKTTYLGWVDSKEVDFYYQICDAVIMPSRWEGFGLVAIEAMRNGKAVIASNQGALPELVHHGVNGYIFDINKSREISETISKLEKSKLKEMGCNGREDYQIKYQAKFFALATNKIYREVLDIRKL